MDTIIQLLIYIYQYYSNKANRLSLERSMFSIHNSIVLIQERNKGHNSINCGNGNNESKGMY